MKLTNSSKLMTLLYAAPHAGGLRREEPKRPLPRATEKIYALAMFAWIPFGTLLGAARLAVPYKYSTPILRRRVTS
jgi:hypothetical protein